MELQVSLFKDHSFSDLSEFAMVLNMWYLLIQPYRDHADEFSSQ